MAAPINDRMHTNHYRHLYPARYSHAQHTLRPHRTDGLPADGNLDRVGDYVARSLVPVMLNRSDRALQLVMNFGRLTLDDQAGGDGSGAGRVPNNAIIYNAPGGVLTMAGNESSQHRAGHVLGHAVRHIPFVDHDIGARVERDYHTGYCPGCRKRRMLWSTGYCTRCEAAGWDGSFSSGRELDGARYRRDWREQIERYNMLRRARERDAERLPGEYYSESEYTEGF